MSELLKSGNILPPAEKASEKNAVSIYNCASVVNTDEKEMDIDDSESDSRNSESDVEQQSASDDRFKALERDLMKYRSKREKIFYLKNAGIDAVVEPSGLQEKNSFSSPLYVEDIRNLLLKSSLGKFPFRLHWSKLEPPGKKFKTVLIEIEGLSVQDIGKLYELFPTKKYGSHIIKILSSNLHFATELSKINFSEFYTFSKKKYHSLFPMDLKRKRSDELNDITKTTNPTEPKLTKLHLLLKPIEMAMETYPLPQKQFTQAVDDNYYFTKDKYTPVTANSPMFALDCEMGLSASGQQEVLWIAIVNENLETVYQSFVKPEEEIIDYMTQFSGVTEEMLRDVKTTLNDVQRKIREILPKDAILCGHSLNFDLHALKLLHPYVIDTSVIFNSYGIRGIKSSLKTLVLRKLSETIQTNSHNPVEDAVATMKLVHFRLENPLSKDFPERVKKHSFFSRISESSRKVCIVGRDDLLRNYCGEIPEKVTFVKKSGVKEILEAVSSEAETHDLILSHSVIEASNYCIEELRDEIKRVYSNLSYNTLFLLMTSDIYKNVDENFKFNYCTIVLKKALGP